MQDTELEWKLCARTPLSAVADSKGCNASTGASQVKIFTFQLTSHVPPLRVREFWCVAKA